MANIPGASGVIPGVYTDVVTQTSGVSVPGGVRLAAVLGEGSRSEVLVSAALGGGLDGFDETYETTAGSDGRHFTLGLAPIISNRFTIYRNGIPLDALEETIDTDPFDNQYDCRVDIETGQIELQTAYLEDLGGTQYTIGSTNFGEGTIENLTLVDENAPTETWTIKCVSVQRDGYGNPMTETAKFLAFGTVSGAKVDGYGNPVLWLSDNEVVSNGILSFSILQDADLGAENLKEGDSFTVKVKSGVLLKNDSLTATYIATIDLNDPTFFDSMEQLSAKHGLPSLDNNLSLGSALAFSNSTPGVVALQVAPAVPRRTEYDLSDAVSDDDTEIENFIFPLPLGVQPDINSNINFFTTNPNTGVEVQVLPNKHTFYDLDDDSVTPSLEDFVGSTTTYDYFYTVIERDQAEKYATNGVIAVSLTPSEGTLSSSSFTFTAADIGKSAKIFDAADSDNNGTFEIIDVNNGVLTLDHVSGDFAAETGISFQIIDPDDTSSYVVINKSVVTAGHSLRISMVDERDVAFYDAGWLTALEALETVDVDIVVPLPKQTISAIFQNVVSHCRTMSNIQNKRERVAFIGAIAGLDPEHVLGDESVAVEDIGILEGLQGDSVAEILSGNTEDLADYSVSAAYGNTYRAVYFYPDEIVVQIGADRVEINGFYMAAAAAGYMTSVSTQMPLTNKVLAGFTILKTKRFSPTVLQRLVGAGITVVQPVSGGGTVIQGKTTTVSGFPEEEEISIIFIRDRIAKSMRSGFAGFIGLPEDPTLLASLTSRAVGLLNSFVSQGLITSFSDLNIKRDSVDPRQWNVAVRVQPTYPVNWVYIKVSVGIQ